VLLPTLLTAVYTLFVATPRYTSEFELTYQTYRGPSSLASGLVQSVTGTAQNNMVDLGTIVYEYLRSSTLADKLDHDLDLRKQFAASKIDWMSRLDPDSSREAFLDYFRSRVQVSQGLGGYIKVDVDAFDPAFAQTLAKAIVAAADAMVDDLTARARANEVKFAEAELGREEERVRKARTAMTAFQNRQGDQDPSRAANQLGTIVGSIEGQLADARSQLTTTMSQLAPNSPIVVQLKSKIAALEGQLKAEQGRLASDKPAGSGSAAPYSQVLDDYQALQLEQDFAKNAYMAAQQGLVVARADAATKQNYLVDFISPNLPQHESYTFPIEAIVTVFLSALLLFAFGSLVMGAARDQIMG
jgi:capsular polysaccharide transport system permease protein